jgi:predicted RNA-binding protein associated with RNAse of E/G family
MVALRTGKITPDEFRAITRRLRQQNGQQQHDRDKARATAAFCA